ncbi:MAG: outer membrane lipoprotein carrier protein LolA [Alphaproteobacteria bacterium]|nr:MAG: outer membrane lipoprotein carrier protein LolA [Alphaproteobacteria bacterium]
MIDRRLLLISTFAYGAPSFALAQRGKAIAPLTDEEQGLVDKAVAYLQDMNQVKGRFTQTDPRGRAASGDIYLKRPGKVRFAYDPPNELLVVSDGARVSVHDKRLKTFQQYALSMTPLSLFLAKQIRLDRGVRVTKVNPYADGFAIVAQDGRHETAGQVTLVFGSDPMILKEWTIIDAQGGSTRVRLSGLTPVSSLDPSLFVLRDPRPPPVRSKT